MVEDGASCSPTLPRVLLTLGDAGQDYEAPGQDSGDAFSSVCSCVVFMKSLYVSTADEEKRQQHSIFDSCFFVTAAKEAAVTSQELTHATSPPSPEQKKRHRDCFDSTHRTYVSRSVIELRSSKKPFEGVCKKCDAFTLLALF